MHEEYDTYVGISWEKERVSLTLCTLKDRSLSVSSWASDEPIGQATRQIQAILKNVEKVTIIGINDSPLSRQFIDSITSGVTSDWLMTDGVKRVVFFRFTDVDDPRVPDALYNEAQDAIALNHRARGDTLAELSGLSFNYDDPELIDETFYSLMYAYEAMQYYFNYSLTIDKWELPETIPTPERDMWDDEPAGPPELPQLTDEMTAFLTITRHRETVANTLRRLANEIERRAFVHDHSKLRPDEFAGFVLTNKIGRELAYGTDEYVAAMKPFKEPGGHVDRHFKRNSHHAEYHDKPEDMGFFDLLEMVVDWNAAAETYGTNTLAESIEVQKRDLALTDAQWWFVDQIAAWLTAPQDLATEQAKARAILVEDLVAEFKKGMEDLGDEKYQAFKKELAKELGGLAMSEDSIRRKYEEYNRKKKFYDNMNASAEAAEPPYPGKLAAPPGGVVIGDDNDGKPE